MNKQDVIRFFNEKAAGWDADMIRSDRIINTILDNAEIRSGNSVLDVACGTGVLFPDYVSRNITDITAIDISPKMVTIAQNKFPQVQVLCGDVEQTAFDRQFDRIMVYNAFPHFPDPENLIRVLSGLLTPGGTLTVAHGMSRATIDAHHKGNASKVSVGLMDENSLADIFSKYLTVTVKTSDDQMYQVTGKRL